MPAKVSWGHRPKGLLGTFATNPDRLGGKATIAGTRFSASFILACLAEGMAYEDIVRDYSEFPRESIAEVLRFAAEVTDRHDVAA